MKSIKIKVVGFLSLIFLTQPLAAGAAEIADVKFEKQYPAPENDLELKGVGLLRYLGYVQGVCRCFLPGRRRSNK